MAETGDICDKIPALKESCPSEDANMSHDGELTPTTSTEIKSAKPEAFSFTNTFFSILNSGAVRTTTEVMANVATQVWGYIPQDKKNLAGEKIRYYLNLPEETELCWKLVLRCSLISTARLLLKFTGLVLVLDYFGIDLKALGVEKSHGTKRKHEEISDESESEEEEVESKKLKPDTAYTAITRFVRRMFGATETKKRKLKNAPDQRKPMVWNQTPDINFTLLPKPEASENPEDSTPHKVEVNTPPKSVKDMIQRFSGNQIKNADPMNPESAKPCDKAGSEAIKEPTGSGAIKEPTVDSTEIKKNPVKDISATMKSTEDILKPSTESIDLDTKDVNEETVDTNEKSLGALRDRTKDAMKHATVDSDRSPVNDKEEISMSKDGSPEKDDANTKDDSMVSTEEMIEDFVSELTESALSDGLHEFVDAEMDQDQDQTNPDEKETDNTSNEINEEVTEQSPNKDAEKSEEGNHVSEKEDLDSSSRELTEVETDKQPKELKKNSSELLESVEHIDESRSLSEDNAAVNDIESKSDDDKSDKKSEEPKTERDDSMDDEVMVIGEIRDTAKVYIIPRNKVENLANEREGLDGSNPERSLHFKVEQSITPEVVDEFSPEE